MDSEAQEPPFHLNHHHEQHQHQNQHQHHRRPLQERNDSQSNTRAAIRLVPKTPPQLLAIGGSRDEVYSSTAAFPSHLLGAAKAPLTLSPALPALGDQFQQTIKAHTTPSSTGLHTTKKNLPARQPLPVVHSATGSPASKPKPLPKKRLHIHKDNKTFSLLQDDPHAAPDGSNPPTPSPTKQASSDVLPSDQFYAQGWSNSTVSCAPDPQSTGSPAPTTPASRSVHPINADPISTSPWNYQFVGGLRKVAKTPDLKQKAAVLDTSSPALPDISENTHTQHLSTKPSFHSADSVITVSETSNYKVYRDVAEPEPPSPSHSNYHFVEESSPVVSSSSSVIHRPRTPDSEDDNYQLHGDSSPAVSYRGLQRAAKYSQESLIVPPLNPAARKPKEGLNYSKSRSGESQRTGSLTSISTILSQQEAFRAVVGTGSIIHLPAVKQKSKASSSWAEPSGTYPPRSHMNEHPHQWSSQLSTVLSESDSGTDRGSQSWSDDGGRGSSGLPSSASHHSRRMLSISSSLAQEERYSRSRSHSIDTPTPAFTRNGQRQYGGPSSSRYVGDQDEYGDGITDMQDLRARPSRGRLSSGFFSATSSDNGRTYTMRSNTTTRSNSLLASSIPAWARLYYGSGERRYIGAPGSSTEGTDSRTNSFRSGSPNTDHFPLGIYSPRRRPRNVHPRGGRRDSLEINPAPQFGMDGQLINDPYSRRFRTWSMSSIWSPHLRPDRRAARRSVWEPPSVTWSTEGGWFGRRNVQIVMFITGFIFPLAWIIAAFLPLPPQPVYPNMRERDNSTSNLDSSNDTTNEYARQFGPMDEARYESALWWRKLNRWMSFVGVLIIASIIVLVVIGAKMDWGRPPSV